MFRRIACRPTFSDVGGAHERDSHGPTSAAARPAERCARTCRTGSSLTILPSRMCDHAPRVHRAMSVLVGDEHDRLARRRSAPGRCAMISSEVARVEVPGRLVGEEDGRVGDEGPRDRPRAAAGRPRAATGSGARARRGRPAPERRERTASGAREPPSAPLAVEERQLDVLEGGRAGEQVEALEHEADLGVADLGELRRASSPETSTPSSRYAPEVGRSRQPRMFISVRLAGARGPHDRDELARLDRPGRRRRARAPRPRPCGRP